MIVSLIPHFLKNHWTVCQLQAMRVATGSMKWFLIACLLLVNYDDLRYTFDLCRGCSDVDVPVVLQWLQTYIRSTHRSIGSTKESHNIHNSRKDHKGTISLYYVSTVSGQIQNGCFDMFWLWSASNHVTVHQTQLQQVLDCQQCGCVELNTRFQASIFFEGFRARSTRETRVSCPGFQNMIQSAYTIPLDHS